MSALSSATRILAVVPVGSGCRSVSAERLGGQPSQRLFDVGRGAEAQRRGRGISPRRDRRDPFPRKVCRADRETHGEHRSFSEDAGDVDGAAVDGDELADQRQADAGTLVRARRGPFDAVKSIEDVVEIVRRDADPGVSHAELDVGVGRRHRHPDRALERELERVRQQIEDDLFPHLAVDVDRASATADSRPPIAARPVRWPIGTRWRGRRSAPPGPSLRTWRSRVRLRCAKNRATCSRA